MTKQEAIDESIEHHERMSAWVEGLSDKEKRRRPDSMDMLAAIEVTWSAAYCALCRKTPGDCEENPHVCSLSAEYGPCGFSGENAWGSLNRAKTWKGWLYHDRRLIKQLKSL